ncbi:hypothetical protein LJB42_003321 [Komagataella kurtzmanii]|nr:hypothetical protein LJB42_003321 [Komagataella kurtzmanii]
MKLLHSIFWLTAIIQLSLALTYKQLQEKYLKGANILKIDNKNYKLIEEAREDFELVLFITANGADVNCRLCKEFQTPFEILANSYATNKAHYSEEEIGKPVVFAISDFTYSRKFFEALKLQNVPKIFHYASTEKASSALNVDDEFDFTAADLITHLRNWITAKTKVDPKLLEIHIPPNYNAIATNFMVALIILIVIYKKYELILTFLGNKNLWQGLSMVTIVAFIAGHMFNTIRNTQYIMVTQGGSPVYIQPGHQQQLGVETQIVGLIYGSLFALSVLLYKAGASKEGSSGWLSILISVLVFLLYSGLIGVFHLKNMGYPYSLIHLF